MRSHRARRATRATNLLQIRHGIFCGVYNRRELIYLETQRRKERQQQFSTRSPLGVVRRWTKSSDYRLPNFSLPLLTLALVR